jgi:hypothetical protein
MKQDVQSSLDKVEGKLAELQAQQAVSINQQKELLKKAHSNIEKINRNLNGLQKRLEPYLTEDGEPETPSQINSFLELRGRYEDLLVLRKQEQDAIQIIEESLAEAELGMTSPVNKGSDKTLGAIVDE